MTTRTRVKIDRALQDSEARFAGILAIAADAIVTIDETQRIVHFNHAAERMFGWPAHQAIGQPIDMLLPPDSARIHHRHVEGFSRGPETALHMEDRRTVAGRRQNGQLFPADVSVSKLSTSQGLIFTAVIRDATTRRRIEHHDHTLAIAGARLAGTLEYAAVLRIIVDIGAGAVGDCCVLDVVESGEGSVPILRRVVSTDTDPVRDRVLRSIEHRGLDWDSPSEAIDLFRTGADVLHVDLSPDWLEAHAFDAEELADLTAMRLSSILAVPLKARNRVIGVLTVGACERSLDALDLDLARAVADRAALAIENALLFRQAQRALAARDEVLAIVSHDLRTPASAIAMCARTLLEHPPEEQAARRELYATIMESANWTHRLMQDLLDAAAIDAGRLSVLLEQAPIAPIVTTAMDQFAERARAAQLTLRATVEPDLPDAMIDGERILQLLGNLLTNALRFTPAGGTIDLSAHAESGGVVLSVRDSGGGIKGEHLPHLFDRFWQVRQAGVAQGTGLGLAIAKGIVEAHHGTISVESEVGRGSTFSVMLPVT